MKVAALLAASALPSSTLITLAPAMAVGVSGLLASAGAALRPSVQASKVARRVFMVSRGSLEIGLQRREMRAGCPHADRTGMLAIYRFVISMT
jgi:hypothetical protein